MFHETLEEIEAEMFASAQLPARLLKGDGMHVVSGASARNRGPDTDPYRIQYKRDHARRKDLERIREALLAGQRPKPSRNHAPPTRWLEVAKELGIDL